MTIPPKEEAAPIAVNIQEKQVPPQEHKLLTVAERTLFIRNSNRALSTRNTGYVRSFLKDCEQMIPRVMLDIDTLGRMLIQERVMLDRANDRLKLAGLPEITVENLKLS
jgi:hypothetical protein